MSISLFLIVGFVWVTSATHETSYSAGSENPFQIETLALRGLTDRLETIGPARAQLLKIANLIESNPDYRDTIHRFRGEMNKIDIHTHIKFEQYPTEFPIMAISLLCNEVVTCSMRGIAIYNMLDRPAGSLVSQDELFKIALLDGKGAITTVADVMRKIPELKRVPESGLPIEQNAHFSIDPVSGRARLEFEAICIPTPPSGPAALSSHPSRTWKIWRTDKFRF